MPQTIVVFFQETDGSIPTLDWLRILPQKAQDKCTVKIERLAALGHELRRPEADYLRDKIYELRIGLWGVNYRILYFFYGDCTAILSHGIVKEGQVPPKEIDKAIDRRIRFESDPEMYTYQRKS
ncbi:MAG: type II toxin-antitoxin system RelE/ParE family toxin [Acaryochloris sp. RU_4_1]|nr:type II toxin-antitoxin system RelE/ParE family toxin [Acaryochloris sp. RU_4_1]NJR54652.1 type II toxin-antitoxin system RelE/ParE family toxin [Acaryochloris sp. CRU_2_0]